MSHAAAPGKIILFGEHAVVFGEPAIAIGIDLETKVDAMPDERLKTHMVNNRPISTYAHLFIEKAVHLLWENAGNTTPLNLRTTSRLPSAAGLGSSAALSTATCASLLHLTGQFSEVRLARASYETEWLGQEQRGSPIDTSASTHGQAIYVSTEKRDEHLWTLRRGERTWHIHHQDLPRMTFVVAHSGQKGKTADAVAKVQMYVERTDFAQKIIRDLGAAALEGREALMKGNLPAVGELMDEAHDLLGMLGVSTSRLDDLCRVARDNGAHGAKLTGAGAGGCIVALAEDPEAVRDALVADRAEAWIVRSAMKGARAWGKPAPGKGVPSRARRERRRERGPRDDGDDGANSEEHGDDAGGDEEE